jgi:hypothetical protein
MNSGNILITTDGGYGVLAGSSVSLQIVSTSTSHSHYAGKAVSNMATPLLQLLREQQVVIRFLWSQGANTAEMHRRMLLQYGDSFPAQRKEYE